MSDQVLIEVKWDLRAVTWLDFHSMEIALGEVIGSYCRSSMLMLIKVQVLLQ